MINCKDFYQGFFKNQIFKYFLLNTSLEVLIMHAVKIVLAKF